MLDVESWGRVHDVLSLRCSIINRSWSDPTRDMYQRTDSYELHSAPLHQHRNVSMRLRYARHKADSHQDHPRMLRTKPSTVTMNRIELGWELPLPHQILFGLRASRNYYSNKARGYVINHHPKTNTERKQCPFLRIHFNEEAYWVVCFSSCSLLSLGSCYTPNLTLC